MPGNKNKALFLDRDGVINVDCAYPCKPEQIRFTEGIFDLCAKAIEKKYLIVVVTNQAGVAKGKFKEEDVVALHSWMGERFQERRTPIARFYYCPFHKDATIEKYRVDSDCRKPKPGMILQAEKDFDINREASLMVGDKNSDRIQLPGLKCIIVKSNYVPEGYDVESLKDVKRLL